MKVSEKTGVQEWADKSFNYQIGCSHDCKYCYAKKMAQRFNKDYPCWTEVWYRVPKSSHKLLNKKNKGVIMFPTTHDITDDLYRAVRYLSNLLENGNKVLWVSKSPYIDVVLQNIISKKVNIENLELRVSIGSADDEVLKHFEPKAGTFAERINALEYAYNIGVKTSVSIEPMLDYDSASVVYLTNKYVSESIWLGYMNNYKLDKNHEIEKRVPTKDNFTYFDVLEILRNEYYDKVKFKDSVVKAMNKHYEESQGNKK